MRTFVTCMQCLTEKGRPNFSSFRVDLIPDDGVLEMVCDAGHHTVTVIQNEKYEILAELAISALKDGYYREAVASFAASLERLFEYYVQIVALTKGISAELFARAWKPLARQSERQLGSFSILYLLENNEPFNHLHNDFVKFRNDVIHKGMIPKKEDAMNFGQAVADCAFSIVKLLHAPKYADAIKRHTFDSLNERGKRVVYAGGQQATTSIATPFQFREDTEGFSIAASLKEYEARPDINEAVTQCHELEDLLRHAEAGNAEIGKPMPETGAA